MPVSENFSSSQTALGADLTVQVSSGVQVPSGVLISHSSAFDLPTVVHLWQVAHRRRRIMMLISLSSLGGLFFATVATLMLAERTHEKLAPFAALDSDAAIGGLATTGYFESLTRYELTASHGQFEEGNDTLNFFNVTSTVGGSSPSRVSDQGVADSGTVEDGRITFRANEATVTRSAGIIEGLDGVTIESDIGRITADSFRYLADDSVMEMRGSVRFVSE